MRGDEIIIMKQNILKEDKNKKEKVKNGTSLE